MTIAVTQMTRNLVDQIKEDALEALQPVAEKYGIAVEKCPGSFSTTSATIKFEFCVKDANGQALNAERRALIPHLSEYKLSEADINRTFTMPNVLGGKEFRVVGWRPRAIKRPLLIEAVDSGKQYVAGEMLLGQISRLT